MLDLEKAKKELYDKKLTLAIVKNGILVYQTDSHRISGFVNAIEKLGSQLKGASVADRVAGKALALLCVYAEISHVYAEVLSKKAQAVFVENNVVFEWKEIVDNVLDPKKTGACPFENIAAEIMDPKGSYCVFKELLNKIKVCQ